MNLANANTLLTHLKWLQEHRPDKFNMGYWLAWKLEPDHNSAAAISFSLNQLHTRLKSEWMLDNPTISPTECNTVACLAGHVVLLTQDQLTNPDEDAYTVATRWLDLDPNTAHSLFYGLPPLWASFEEQTLENAIGVLEKLILTETRP